MSDSEKKVHELRMLVSIFGDGITFKLVKLINDEFINKLYITLPVSRFYIDKIISICKYNNSALIHSKDENENIRKLCKIKLKYNEKIVVYY